MTCQPCTEGRHCINMVTAQTIWKQHFNSNKTSLQPCSSEGCCTDMVPVWHPRDAMQYTYPFMFCLTGRWEIFGFSVPPMLLGSPGMPSSSASCNGYLHTIWLATVRDKMWTICSQRDLPTKFSGRWHVLEQLWDESAVSTCTSMQHVFKSLLQIPTCHLLASHIVL